LCNKLKKRGGEKKGRERVGGVTLREGDHIAG